MTMLLQIEQGTSIAGLVMIPTSIVINLFL